MNTSTKQRLLIVTPTLGDSEFLQQTLDSISSLTFPITHILSCPASKVEALKARCPKCIVVEDAGKSGGIYGALNCAIEQASGNWDWFTYINDDDLLGPDFEKVYLQHCSKEKAEDVLYGNVRLIDSEARPLGFITNTPSPDLIPAMLQQQMSPLNQQGMLFSRKCVEFLKGFDLQYKLCADLDFWARAYAGQFPFVYAPYEVGQFRIRAGQLSGNVNLTHNELSDIVRRHFPHPISWVHRKIALLSYRLFNLPRYLHRIRKVGLKTSEDVLAS